MAEEKKEKKEKALFWSSFDLYQNCPQRFLFKYGHPAYDLGAGFGEPKPVSEQRSEHHAIMGVAIQYAIEHLYNDLLWKRLLPSAKNHLTVPELIAILKELVWIKMDQQIQERYVDWRRAPSHGDMAEICIDGVLGYLRTMQANQFLGEYAKAEQLYVNFIGDVPVGARVDLVLRRDPKPGRTKNLGITLLDGKNSKHKNRWTNPDQLRWYAMLFFLCYNRLPDRAGFVYYRYPYGMATKDGGIEQGVDWVDLDRQDIRGLAQRAVDVRNAIRRREFDPKPIPAYCRYCDWEKDCPERQAQLERNRKKRGKRKTDGIDDEFPLPVFESDDTGIQEIG